MTRQDAALLRQIEEAAHDEGKSLAGALRKCIAYGAHAGSTELRDWAAEELNGYDPAGDLLEYRKVGAPILVDWIATSQSTSAQMKGQRISVGDLPKIVVEEGIDEIVTLAFGVGQLEAMVRPGETLNLSLPGAAEITKLMTIADRGVHQFTNVYWAVDTSIIEGVLHRIRNALVQLVAEIRAGMPADQDVPSPDVATQALNVAVHGKKARVNVSSAQSVEGSARSSTNAVATPNDAGWPLWRKIGAAVVGIATIAGAVFAYLALR